ncbi:hypothetical protein ERC79_13595 [Rhodococcus sp. ABRD24]|uniref:phytanoyl-CoA dioxygenase family protein n=1 Tax=Rhodococcus sp. ABRD24 TaxID=2507582 RepID=UPI001039DAF9|nr:phytanoyl-CoA dioxygenase family protein [Rhodococcus sp. ABRD24]QBJ96867.1 hypothetical protein ERC79_13595 [Rhodococcus sp. ABRD24]
MITQELIDQFNQQGVVRVPGVLRPGDFVAVRQEFADLLRERAERWCGRGLIAPEVLNRFIGDFERDLLMLSAVHGFDTELLAELDICLPHSPFSAITSDALFHVGPGLLRLISTPHLLDTIESFIGNEISVSGNAHIRLKLPAAKATTSHVGRSAANTAAETPWHTDGITMVEESMDTPLITVWIPLRDVGAENGCLLFLPGSHHVPDSVPWPVGPELRAELNRKAVTLPARFGDVIILHKHVAHASAPNISDFPRWSFDLRFFDHTRPGDRPWFPSIPLRSVTHPESVVTSGEEWRTRWEKTRARLAAAGRPLPGRPVYARAVAEAYLRRWSDGDYGPVEQGHR